MQSINKARAHLNFHEDTQCVPVDHDKQLFDYSMDRVGYTEKYYSHYKCSGNGLNEWLKVPAIAAQQCRILYSRNHACLHIINIIIVCMESIISLEWKTYQVTQCYI